MAHNSDAVVEVAEVFAAIARELAGSDDLGATLHKVVRLAVDHLDACQHAGISVIRSKQVSCPASSGEIPRLVDAIQCETGEGPCIDAIREHEVFLTGDLAGERRWPAFARRAYDETGVLSIASLRLFVDEDTMGSLNLYSTDKDAFDDSDVALGSVFAAHAAVALVSARRQADLQRMSDTRELIGRAKGILMARHGITDDEAFTRLRQASQSLNRKLSRVAEDVSFTGEVPSS